jgi:flagellar assembly factor FliW
MHMSLTTQRFGQLNIEAKNIIHFRDGMLGFSGSHRFVLLESSSSPLVMWLQSLDDDQVAFPVVEAWIVKKNYPLNMTSSDKIALNYQDGDQLKSYVVLLIPEKIQDMTANLRAPVVINSVRGTGAQVIQQDRELNIRTPVYKDVMTQFSQYKIQQSAPDQAVSQATSSAKWSAVGWESTATV